MSAVGEPELPGWAAPYLPAFRRIRHAIELSEGFILMPIEVLGEDVPIVLAEWLTRTGHPAVLINGRSAVGPASNVLDARRAPNGVVIVVVGSEILKQLKLLNQHRDQLARQIDGPLLWCGGRRFLDATWRHAPDFWSIADVPRHLDGLEAGLIGRPQLPKRIARTFGFSAHRPVTPFHQAVDQGDVLNAARLGMLEAEGKVGLSDFRGARQVIAEVRALLGKRGDTVLEARAALLAGRIALMIGALPDASADLVEALRLSRLAGDAELELEADAELALGNLRAQIDRLDEAKELYVSASRIYARTANARKIADTIVAQADLHASAGQHDEADAGYTRALAIYKKSAGDSASDAGMANALVAKGELYANSDRLKEAEAAYFEALSLYRAKSAGLGEATTLAALGDLYAKIDRFAEAVESYEKAAVILHEIGVPAWEDRINEALAAVRVRPPPGAG